MTHNNTLLEYSEQDSLLNLFCICKSRKPEQRSSAEAMARTGKSFPELQLANVRKRFIRYLHILKVKAQIGACSLRELARHAKADWRTCKEALKYTLQEAALQVREAFRTMFLDQGTNMVGDVRARNTQRNEFLLRFLRQPEAEEAATETQEAVERSGTARKKSGDASRSLNIIDINKETGEVFMQQDHFVSWTPQSRGDKPPKSYMAAQCSKEKEKSASLPLSRTEPPSQSKPIPRVMPPLDAPEPRTPKLPDRPIRNASSPIHTSAVMQKMRAQAAPPPPELKEQFNALIAKLSLQTPLEERRKRMKLEWVPANEDYFRENAAKIDAVMARRNRPFR